MHEQGVVPLSDVPLGEGWWVASDGRWYPPDAHPDAAASQALAARPNVQPAEGWWQASDGRWYAPELHPDRLGPAATLSTSSARSAVTRSAAAAAPGGFAVSSRQAPAAGTPTLPGVPELFSTPAPAPTLAPPLRPPAVPPEAATPPPSAPADDALGVPGGGLSLPPGALAPDGSLALELFSSPLVGPGTGPLGGPGAGPPPRDRSFNGSAGIPPAGRATPGLRTPAQARPVTPGFGDTHTAPPGSTVRSERPSNRLAPAPQNRNGQLGKLDGFEDWVSSIVSDQAPAPRSLNPPRPAQPPQRLMGVADVLSSARVTMGGPASAVPPKTTAESDFYVMRPTRKKARPDEATPKRPRAKLATSVFLFVLVAVIAAVAIAFFLLHH